MKPTPKLHREAFTLVEVMVSSALLVFIMVLVISTVDQTQKVWSRAQSKVSQFQSARNAFESMTQGRAHRAPLSRQAALNEIVRLAGKQFDPDVVDAQDPDRGDGVRVVRVGG